MIPLQCLCLFCRPNPFLCILHHQIKQRIFNCSPLFKCAWKHKVNLKVIGTQLLQGMVASQQRGIFSPLLLREPQSLFILGSLQKNVPKKRSGAFKTQFSCLVETNLGGLIFHYRAQAWMQMYLSTHPHGMMSLRIQSNFSGHGISSRMS